MNLEQTILEAEPVIFDLRPAAPTDVQAVVQLINACAAVRDGNGRTNISDVQEEWALLDLEQSTRVAVLPDGRIAGYAEVWDNDPLPVNNWVWARTHPDLEGQGIGTALMDWVDERLQKTVERVPDDLQVGYHCGTLSSYQPSKDLLEDRGLTLQRHFWRMVIDFNGAPPAPVWPEGLHVSTYAAEGDLLAVFRADQEAFRDHWGFVEQPEEEAFAEWQKWTVEREKHDPALWFLAMDGKEIAGICLCKRDVNEDPDMGWVSSLGVREAWRKRGLGLALLQHAFGVFYREDKRRVGLGVDAASLTGATRLYEKAGMTVASRFDNYEKVVRPGRDIARRD